MVSLFHDHFTKILWDQEILRRINLLRWIGWVKFYTPPIFVDFILFKFLNWLHSISIDLDLCIPNMYFVFSGTFSLVISWWRERMWSKKILSENTRFLQIFFPTLLGTVNARLLEYSFSLLNFFFYSCSFGQ